MSQNESPQKPKRKRKKETKKERMERYNRENAEAKVLGLSYGKYQQKKMQGTLPADIQLPPPPEHHKILPKSDFGYKEIERINRDLAIGEAAVKMQDEYHMKKIAARGEFYARRHRRMMQRQKEAVQAITSK